MKNKLIIVFSLVLLIILLPSNVFADSYTIWRISYKNNGLSQYDSSHGYYGQYSSGLNINTDYTTTLYYNSSQTSFSKGLYDYVEIPILFTIGSNYEPNEASYYTIPNADTMYYVYNGVTANFGMWYSNSGYEAYSSCTFTPTQYTGIDLNGILKCPVNRVADSVLRLQVKYSMSPEWGTGNSYETFFGTDGWMNFLYKDDNSSSIVNAINNQTSSINNNQNNTTNAINNTTNAINDVNDSITDSSGNSNTDNANAIQGFENQLASNNTISSLITMPITLYQKILNSVNGSCSPFTLGQLLGTNVVFPCINPSTYLGSSLWSIIDVIISGLLIFAISKRFIKIFDGFTSMSTTKDEVGD